MIIISLSEKIRVDRGGSRNFSSGQIFEKKIENFVELFFRSTKLIFRALSNHHEENPN